MNATPVIGCFVKNSNIDDMYCSSGVYTVREGSIAGTAFKLTKDGTSQFYYNRHDLVVALAKCLEVTVLKETDGYWFGFFYNCNLETATTLFNKAQAAQKDLTRALLYPNDVMFTAVLNQP